ncbi:hypothetical protein [Bowmanella denitrificans]|uniref:hypothetical protein n=1 Tax=Bowmanella denitrificans TaxID=366582 RepID=UPI000C9A7ED4|nr:hypothetical protein [Bowmanella denitrificans]
MNLKKALICAAVAALTSASAVATEQVVTAGSWGDTYSEAYYGAYNKLLQNHPTAHNITVTCRDMIGAYRCGAVGYVTV